jgi:hypothetical protein
MKTSMVVMFPGAAERRARVDESCRLERRNMHETSRARKSLEARTEERDVKKVAMWFGLEIEPGI